MPNDPFASLDATAQAELVRRGEVAPHALVDAAIERIERINPMLNAVIHPALEQAAARARSSELQHGPLRGVPTLMKDIGGAEAGRPNHAGMRFLKAASYTEREDSHFTQRLKGAGMVSLGRTNTPELALLATTEPEAYGATRNPWNPAVTPGGSSGGAAAAVAAGLVPVAHASDGGGSIRGPASHCALVGLKPSRGRCSFGPGLGERWSGFSNEFMLTRSVRDAALLLDVCAGAFPGDPYSAAPPARAFVAELGARVERLRIGVMRKGPRDVSLDPENLAAVDAMARVLEGLGHVVEEAYPAPLDEAHSIAAYIGVVAVNTARGLARAGESVGREVTQQDVEPLTFTLADLGRQATAVQHLANLEYVHAFGRRLAAWWTSGFDLLLTPTAAAPPPDLGYLTSTPEEPLRAILRSAPYGAFTLPWNLSGQPAISLPCRWTGNDLPLGIQLIAANGREDLLLRTAAQVETASPWSGRRPHIHA
jgi:amidase